MVAQQRRAWDGMYQHLVGGLGSVLVSWAGSQEEEPEVGWEKVEIKLELLYLRPHLAFTASSIMTFRG